MEITENDFNEAFGLEAKAAEQEPTTGAEGAPAASETNDVTETKPETAETGTQTPPAQPAAQESPAAAAETGAPTPAEKANPAPASAEKPASDPAADAHYAAAFVGRKNPYTGKPILSRADYEQYVADQEKVASQARSAEAAATLKKAGIDVDTLNALLAETPVVKEARRAAEFSQRMEQENYRKAVEGLIQKDVEAIGKYDASIRSVDDILKTPQGAEIERMVKSGRHTWLDAWKLANFDAVSTARANAARQEAANAAASKDHLQSTSQRGAGDVDVPAKVAENFAAFGITDPAEQRKAYRDYLKSIKKG